MALPFKQPAPRPDIPWVDLTDQGRPTLPMAQYLTALDTVVRQLASGQVGTLVEAVDDTAARQAGVQIGQMYRNGSQVLIRTV
jgi:hypothetical protein